MTISLDAYKQVLSSYRITPENLYVSFADMGGSAPMLGFQISRRFTLSHPGAEGVALIAKHNSRCLLGCASLATLRDNHRQLQNSPPHEIDQDRLGGLWKAKTFFAMLVPKNTKQFVQVLRVKAFTAQRVEDWAAATHPEHTLALTGTVEDYVEMLAEMEDIVERQDFAQVGCDHRHYFEGVLAHCLLDTKKEPSSIEIDLFVANNLEAQ